MEVLNWFRFGFELGLRFGVIVSYVLTKSSEDKWNAEPCSILDQTE